MEPACSPAILAKAYTALGGLTYWLSDAEATEIAYEAAVHLLRGSGDRGAEAAAMYDLAFVPVMRGDHDEARRRLEASLELAEGGVVRMSSLAQHSFRVLCFVRRADPGWVRCRRGWRRGRNRPPGAASSRSSR